MVASAVDISFALVLAICPSNNSVPTPMTSALRATIPVA